MIFHCFPNFRVGAFRFIHNPRVAGDHAALRADYEEFDADTFPNSQTPHQMLVETTQGGFFNRQNRDTCRVEWQEIAQKG
jgi:hypothetical protein